MIYGNPTFAAQRWIISNFAGFEIFWTSMFLDFTQGASMRIFGGRCERWDFVDDVFALSFIGCWCPMIEQPLKCVLVEPKKISSAANIYISVDLLMVFFHSFLDNGSSFFTVIKMRK